MTVTVPSWIIDVLVSSTAMLSALLVLLGAWVLYGVVVDQIFKWLPFTAEFIAWGLHRYKTKESLVYRIPRWFGRKS